MRILKTVILLTLCATLTASASQVTKKIAFIVDNPAALTKDSLIGNLLRDSLTEYHGPESTIVSVIYKDETGGAFDIGNGTDGGPFALVVVGYDNGAITNTEVTWLADTVDASILLLNSGAAEGAFKMASGAAVQTSSALQVMRRYDILWPNHNQNCGWDSVIVFSQKFGVRELSGTFGVGDLRNLYYMDSATYDFSSFSVLFRQHDPGATLIEIEGESGASGFAVGQTVIFDPGGSNQESHVIQTVQRNGSAPDTLTIATPLANLHIAGAIAQRQFTCNCERTELSNRGLIVAVDSNGLLDDVTTRSKERRLYDGTIAIGDCDNCDKLGESQSQRVLLQALWLMHDTTHIRWAKKVYEGYNFIMTWSELGPTGKHRVFGYGMGNFDMRAGYDGSDQATPWVEVMGFSRITNVPQSMQGRNVDSGGMYLVIDQFANNRGGSQQGSYKYNFDIDLYRIKSNGPTMTVQDLKYYPIYPVNSPDSSLLTARNAYNHFTRSGWLNTWSGTYSAQFKVPAKGVDIDLFPFAGKNNIDSAGYGWQVFASGYDTIYQPQIFFAFPDTIVQSWKIGEPWFILWTDTMNVPPVNNTTTSANDLELIFVSPGDVDGVDVGGRIDSNSPYNERFASRVVLWTRDSVTSPPPAFQWKKRAMGLRRLT